MYVEWIDGRGGQWVQRSDGRVGNAEAKGIDSVGALRLLCECRHALWDATHGCVPAIHRSTLLLSWEGPSTAGMHKGSSWESTRDLCNDPNDLLLDGGSDVGEVGGPVVRTSWRGQSRWEECHKQGFQNEWPVSAELLEELKQQHQKSWGCLRC